MSDKGAGCLIREWVYDKGVGGMGWMGHKRVGEVWRWKVEVKGSNEWEWMRCVEDKVC